MADDIKKKYVVLRKSKVPERLEGTVGEDRLPNETEGDLPDMAALRRPDPTRPNLKQPEFGPNDMVIRTSKDRVLVVIHPNGELEFGPDYTPDEAAELFWVTMAIKRLGSEQRLQLLARMENLFTGIGAADIASEQARRRAEEVQAAMRRKGDANLTEEDARQIKATLDEAARAHRVLEERVHQTIEFSRQLAATPELTALPRPSRTFQEPN